MPDRCLMLFPFEVGDPQDRRGTVELALESDRRPECRRTAGGPGAGAVQYRSSRPSGTYFALLPQTYCPTRPMNEDAWSASPTRS